MARRLKKRNNPLDTSSDESSGEEFVPDRLEEPASQSQRISQPAQQRRRVETSDEESDSGVICAPNCADKSETTERFKMVPTRKTEPSILTPLDIITAVSEEDDTEEGVTNVYVQGSPRELLELDTQYLVIERIDG